jgi:hypothetical protein
MSCDDVHIGLRVPPGILADLGVSEMEFTPELRVARMRGPFDAWRDMDAKESAAVRAWLERKAAAMRAWAERN